jgi:PRTRC genetic system ThiF family protein
MINLTTGGDTIASTPAAQTPVVLTPTAPTPVEIGSSEVVTKAPKTSPPLKMERNIPFVAPQTPTNIIVVGCGGTGSHIIPHLVRLIASKPTKSLIKITFVDGDVVESKNLIRQHFIESDIGKNKAEVLAARYSAAFGIPIAFKDKYIENHGEFSTLLESGATSPIIISCVDNVKTRHMIKTAVDASIGSVLWIDCGNEDMAGQVVLSSHVLAWSVANIEKTRRFPMPDVFELYPDLYTKLANDKFASELSCAEMAVSSPQHGFVNLTAATLALNFIYSLFSNQPIYAHVVEFNIKNKYAHRPLNTSTMSSWVSKSVSWKSFHPSQID